MKISRRLLIQKGTTILLSPLIALASQEPTSLEILLEKAGRDPSLGSQFASQVNAKYNSSNNPNFPYINKILYLHNPFIPSLAQSTELGNVEILTYFFNCTLKDTYDNAKEVLKEIPEDFFNPQELELFLNFISGYSNKLTDNIVRKEADIEMILVHENKHLERMKDPHFIDKYNVEQEFEELVAIDHALIEQKRREISASSNFMEFVKVNYFLLYKIAQGMLQNDFKDTNPTNETYQNLLRRQSTLDSLVVIPHITPQGIELKYKK